MNDTIIKLTMIILFFWQYDSHRSVLPQAF